MRSRPARRPLPEKSCKMSTSPLPAAALARRSKRRLRFVLGACLALLPFAGPGAQEVTHYQVEVLIFLQPAGLSAELPPGPTPAETLAAEAGARLDFAPAPGDVLDANGTPPEPAGPATQLPPGFYQSREPLALTAAAEALRRRGYQPLWHQAWIQPPGDRDGVVLPVLAALGQGKATSGLGGALSLTRGRFLHLGLELEWQPGPELEAVLSQRRRIRSGEEHYFDHPRLGALALVTPLDYSPSGSPASAGAP